MNCPKCGFWADCNCYGELVDKIREVMNDGRTLNVVSDILKGILQEEDNKK